MKVVFRKDKKMGDIIAFMPEIPSTRGNIMSYQHIGQHSEASYDYYTRGTVKAEENEYSDLLKELQGIYAPEKIEVRLKITQQMYSNMLKMWSNYR